MARIKIKDLPKDMKITKEELKRVRGGAYEFYYPSDVVKVDSLRYSSPTRFIPVFEKIV